MISDSEFEEIVSGAWNRRRVITMSIINNARTPEQIMAVARSIGEGEYGDDELVLQLLADYWAEEPEN